MLKHLSAQVHQAIEKELYYVALYTALTLPDIAGAVEYGNKVKNGERYRRWLDDFAGREFSVNWSGFSSQDCWNLRNSILHEGNTEHTLMALRCRDTVASPGVYQRQDGKLVIDLNPFCQNLCRAFDVWLWDKEESDLSFRQRLESAPTVQKGKLVFH